MSCPPKLRAERIPLDRGGYVRSGAWKGRYFGVGQHVYLVYSDSAEHDFSKFVRAENANTAKRKACAGGTKGIGMAKRRKKRRKLAGAYGSPSSANRRKYTKVASGSPVTRSVPRACAIVQNGAKKGKLRKGCRIRGGKAFCDKLTKLPAVAWKKKGGYRYSVECPR